MFEMFYIRCKKNNTLVGIDSRGSREAVQDVCHAKRFGLETSALDFMDEVASKEGYYFKEDHEVVKGSEYDPNSFDPAAWPHVDLREFTKLAERLGITNLSRFRGRLGHFASLLHNGNIEEVSLLLKELKDDGHESSYPTGNNRYSSLENSPA